MPGLMGTGLALCYLTVLTSALTYEKTDVSEQFLKQDDEACYIQATFGGSVQPKGLSDMHLSVEATDRGVLLNAEYIASEQKPVMQQRLDHVMAPHKVNISKHFDNVQTGRCLMSMARQHPLHSAAFTFMGKLNFALNCSNATDGTVSVSSRTVFPNMTTTIEVLKAEINSTLGTIDCTGQNCTISSCLNCTDYDDDDSAGSCVLPLQMYYSVTLSPGTNSGNHTSTYDEIISMTLINVTMTDVVLKPDCNCSNWPSSESDREAECECTLPSARDTLLYTGAMTEVYNYTRYNYNAVCKERIISDQSKYLKNPMDWTSYIGYTSLVNATFCEDAKAPQLFGLYMYDSGIAVPLTDLTPTVPWIEDYRSYGTPLRSIDVTYVHCQPPLQSTVRKPRSAEGRPADHVDRTSNFMVCIMQYGDETSCSHLNDRNELNRIRREVRARRAPPGPTLDTRHAIRLAASKDGPLQSMFQHHQHLVQLYGTDDVNGAWRQAQGGHQHVQHLFSENGVIDVRQRAEQLILEKRAARIAAVGKAPVVPPRPAKNAPPRPPRPDKNAPPRPPKAANNLPPPGAPPPPVPPRLVQPKPGPFGRLRHKLVHFNDKMMPPQVGNPMPITSDSFTTPMIRGGRIVTSPIDSPVVPPRIIRSGPLTETHGPQRIIRSGPLTDTLGPQRIIRSGPLTETLGPQRIIRSGPLTDTLPGNQPLVRGSAEDIYSVAGGRQNPVTVKPNRVMSALQKDKVPMGGACGPKRHVGLCKIAGKPFGGRSGQAPVISKSPYKLLDPDGDGKYGVGKGGLGGGDHIHVKRTSPGGMNGMNGGMMMGAMMVGMMSSGMSSATKTQIDDIVEKKYDTVDPDRATALVVLQKLDQVGSGLATAGMMGAMMGGGPAALAVAAAGIAMQAVTGLVTMGLQIYDIRFPRNPPQDPVLNKYQEYAELLSSDSMGNQWCLMPESKLKVTLAFKPSMDVVKKDALELWVSTKKTVVKVAYNPDLLFNAELEVVCAGGGVLRFDDFNTHSVAREAGTTSGGSRMYRVHQIASMIHTKSIITAQCDGGHESALLIVREPMASNEMVLLRKRGPGEPESSKSMDSDVCDKFPFKRFYVSIPGCSVDRSKTYVGWTTCSMLFRKSVWNTFNNTWMLANPFSPPGSDKKIFTFRNRDFRARFPIEPNKNKHHQALCDNADQQSFCRLPDPMLITDNTMCNNKMRFFRVYLANAGNASIDISQGTTVVGYMLTCPLHTVATHVMKLGSQSENLRVHDSDAFGSVRKFMLLKSPSAPFPVVWIFCRHSTKVGYESDVIELQLDKTAVQRTAVNTRSKAFNDTATRFDMYKVSSRGPAVQRHWTVTRLPDVRLFVNEQKPVVFYMGGGGQIEDTSSTKYYSNVNEEWYVNELEKHWQDPQAGVSMWKWAQDGCKTISSLQVTFSSCEVTGKGDLKIKPLGWWTWSFLDQTQKEGSTLYVGSTSWTLSPGKDIVEYDSRQYNNKMQSCVVKLDLLSKKLTMQCDTTKISKDDIMSDVCLTVSPANDQCNTKDTACGTRTKEWYDMDGKRNCWKEGTRYTSHWYYAHGSEPQIASNFFCQDQGIYWSHVDSNSRYTVIIYKRLLDSNMILVPSYEPGNTIKDTDYFISAKQMRIVEKMQRQLGELRDMSKDPMVSAINEFSAHLTGSSLNVTQIVLPADVVLHSSLIRKERESRLLESIEDALTQLMIDVMRHTDWYRDEMTVAGYKCCRLSFDNGTLVVRSVDSSVYECPGPAFFYRDHTMETDSIMGPSGDYFLKDDLIDMSKTGYEEYVVCPAMQDVIFGDNATMQRFMLDLTTEMDKIFVNQALDNITENFNDMAGTLEGIVAEPLGFFEHRDIYFGADLAGYDVQVEKSTRWGRVAGLFGGLVVVGLAMFYLYRRRQVIRHYGPRRDVANAPQRADVDLVAVRYVVDENCGTVGNLYEIVDHQ